MSYAAAALASALLLAGLFAGWASAQSVAEAFPPVGGFAEVDGVRLHYLETGPEDGEPVLVLHGATGNLNEPLLALNGRLDAYRVLWLDRPGLGWSERPVGRWSPEREADLISGFLAARGVERTAVIGHSWGAAISLRLAMDFPQQVSGLVLVAPAIRAWVGDAAFYNKATGWPVVGTLITRVVVPTYGKGQLEGGAASAFDPEPMPEGYVEDTALPLILRAEAWKANADDMANVNRHLAAQEDRYAEIEHPAVLIAGSEDTVVATDRHAVPVSQTMPNAELVLIEGAGHNPHHAHADGVVQALQDVLARAEGN